MAVLIDSSVWIDWLRKRVDPRPLIRPWVVRRACFTCGIIRVEVVRGIIDFRQKEKVEQLFDALEDIPLTSELWHSVAQGAWELDRKGKILPLSDLVIAECGRRQNAWLVTLDEDFAALPDIRIRQTLPRGEE